MCAAKRARYVEVLNQGLNFTQAASLVGVSKRTSKVWRNGRTRSTGRNEHASVDWYRKPRPISSRYLSQAERITMADCLHAGQSIRPIARRLGRSPSSISREIRRNTNPANGRYEPYLAHQLGHERLKRPKPRRITSNPRLLEYVRDGLARHLSPEQISGRLRREFGDNESMQACAETIYQAIYVQAKGELKLDLEHALR
jgi:IS30 family transposase